MMMEKLHTCAQLIEYINDVGFLPLLNIGIEGWSADDVMDEECRYRYLPEGGWEWPLWDWKGDIIRETGCAYGKFFCGKAAFVTRQWWPDFCNWRRYKHEKPAEGTVEEGILATLSVNGSMSSRQLRQACGFQGKGMRGKFDGYVTRLQMAGYVVTQDFVYAHDRSGRPYGWGFSLLATPESLFGHDACHAKRSAENSRQRMESKLREVVPGITDRQLNCLLG
ncbi:MAG: hypothetical protein SO442_04700 [Prevotella sp.]|nr:hypothetical protein [Prevotella sp.]